LLTLCWGEASQLRLGLGPARLIEWNKQYPSWRYSSADKLSRAYKSAARP
jgi:hypothetical protein